jgi:adenine-specific DNA-methyltransferase
MARKTTKAVAVDSVRHKDKRANIPTEELRSFVAADEAQPKTLLYPRDPSLDPQLVWKGKDEQDRQDLAVPAVPIYIQEKIHPHALIEDLRAQAKQERAEPQLNLYGDFNGLDDEEVFGSENFVSVIAFKTTSGAGSFAGGTNVLQQLATTSFGTPVTWSG